MRRQTSKLIRDSRRKEIGVILLALAPTTGIAAALGYAFASHSPLVWLAAAAEPIGLCCAFVTISKGFDDTALRSYRAGAVDHGGIDFGALDKEVLAEFVALLDPDGYPEDLPQH